MSITPLLLTLLLAEIPGVPRAGAVDCPDIQRIELSRRAQALPEICVSPGFLTGIRFDAPVSVDLQDENRFEDVARSRTSIQLMPPTAMMPGERLRLSMRYLDGASAHEVVFILVASGEHSTRQVEVFRDQRSRESLDAELRHEQTKNQRLREELAQLRRERDELRESAEDPPRLVGLALGMREDARGLRLTKVSGLLGDFRAESPSFTDVNVFRIASSVAFELRVAVNAIDPSRKYTVSVWDERGDHAQVVHVRLGLQLDENQRRPVFVETRIATDWPHGKVSLRLQDAASQGLTVTGMDMH